MVFISIIGFLGFLHSLFLDDIKKDGNNFIANKESSLEESILLRECNKNSKII